MYVDVMKYVVGCGLGAGAAAVPLFRGYPNGWLAVAGEHRRIAALPSGCVARTDGLPSRMRCATVRDSESGCAGWAV